MVALRHDSLADHHLYPAHAGEHLLGIAEEAAAVFEQANVVLQRFAGMSIVRQ
jgi:hypothetical protein